MNEGERGVPPLKRCYSAFIGSSNVKMVADRHKHMLHIITSTSDKLIRYVNVDDLK